MKVLTIGGATEDLYLRTEGADTMHLAQKWSEQSFIILESGAKIEVSEILSFTGGGATNSATSFARLGNEVAPFCKIADDKAGARVRQDLAQEKIDLSLIAQTTEHPTGVSFVIHARSGERTIFAFRGANGHLSIEDVPFEAIAQIDQLYITSLSHDSSALLPAIVAYAKEHKIPVAINPGSSQLAQGALQLKESLKNIDVLIMNSDEARQFMVSLITAQEHYRQVLGGDVAQPICPPELHEGLPRLLIEPAMYQNCLLSTQSFFREMLKSGPHTVVITDGCFGVYAAHESKIYFHAAVQTEVVDTLGAGDAFGSCFVASRAHGYPIEQALRNGNINSASVIATLGAKPGLLSFGEIEARLPAVPTVALQVFDL